ncbi:MAG: transcription elongation factor GreA [Eubacteriales bacterium]|nr:transcription elongation factor GreA [Eubacteriales bacterium]
MANENKTMLTYAGLKKYEDELHNLKVVKRQEVAQKIKVAREQGDLSENADYDAAKEEQSEIERRIDELERILKNAEVVVDDEIDIDKINVGCEVTLFDMEYDEEAVYQIVGSSEANSLEGKISNEAPVGAALIGHKVGEVVDVVIPSGATIQYKVLGIKKIS